MSWTGPYYYRSRWIEGRPVREYAGTGITGELAALEDEEAREARARARTRLRIEQAQLSPLDVAAHDVCQAIDGLGRLALIGAGYHLHQRGEWRRRRRTDAEPQSI